MNGAIVERIAGSVWTLLATTLVLIAGLWCVYRLARTMMEDSSALTKAILELLRYLLREFVGDSDVAPYERINGLVVGGLLLATILLLVILTAQSIRGVMSGEGPSGIVIASFLFCLALFAGAGLTCVNFCRRHHTDLRALGIRRALRSDPGEER